MANGYSNNTTRSKTNQQGKLAPDGYHYMPDGRLMSDAEHYIKFGSEYVINSFDIDYSDIKQSGENRRFTVNGSEGASFSMFVTNEDNSYYNFETNSFQTNKYTLSNIKITGGSYSNFISFPSVSDADQYNIYLFAELGTKHADYREARFVDGTLDLNSTTGSNSLLLQKVIYQTLDTSFRVAPASPTSGNDFDSMSVTTQIVTSSFGKSTPKIPFSITSTSASTKAFQINNQPTQNDIYATETRTVALAKDIPGESIYPTVSNTDTVDGAVSSSNKIVMDTNVASKMAVGDRVTVTSAVTTDTVDGAIESGVKIVMDNNVSTRMRLGDRVTAIAGASQATIDYMNARVFTVAVLETDGNPKAFSLNASPLEIADGATLAFESFLNRDIYTVSALDPDGDNPKEFSILQDGNAIPVLSGLLDGITLSFSNRKNHSFSLNNVEGLSNGMVVTGTNVVANTIIKDYKESINIGEGTGNSYERILQEKPGVLPNPALTEISRNATTNLVTVTTKGSVTFNNQQPLVLEGDTINIYAYGREQVRKLTGWDVEITNLKAELTAVTTTTTSAVSNSTTVPVASGDGIVEGISTVSGIGIDPAVVDPTVSTINSYSGTTASLILSAAQTLEDGITLTFGGGGELVTITGEIKVYKTGSAALALYIDLEKFMTATNEAS